MRQSCVFETLEDRRLLSVSVASITATSAVAGEPDNTLVRAEKATLTASGVTFADPDTKATIVYFIDANSNGVPDKGDKIIGASGNATKNYAVTTVIKRNTDLGPITISAVARGKGHNNFSSAVTDAVTVVNDPPTIKKLIAPKSIKAGKKFVTTAVEAKDKDGTIASIAFTLTDANNLDVSDSHLSANGNSKRSEKVDTTGLAPGVYTLTAVATDNDGGTSTPVTKTFTVT